MSALRRRVEKLEKGGGDHKEQIWCIEAYDEAHYDFELSRLKQAEMVFDQDIIIWMRLFGSPAEDGEPKKPFGWNLRDGIAARLAAVE